MAELVSIVTFVVNFLPHSVVSLTSLPSIVIAAKVALYSLPLMLSDATSAVVSSTTGVVFSVSAVADAFVASSENVSAAGASVATDASEPSLNSAAHTGTLEVASIATTSDILNVFFAMPFFVFLIFVMIIVPLWVVDRLFLWKFSYPE